MNTATTTAPNTLERHIADSLAAAKAFDAKAMQAINAGDRATADENWDTASLLRVSAHMIRQMVAAGALKAL
jgi:hypothetical protein